MFEGMVSWNHCMIKMRPAAVSPLGTSRCRLSAGLDGRVSDRPVATSVRALIPDADPRILRVIDAWLAARHGRLVPLRGDFDPILVGNVLAYVWIYRFRPNQGDYICELTGEQVSIAWGHSIKGMWLRDIVGPTHHPTVLRRWEGLRTQCRILYARGGKEGPGSETLHSERAVMPLAARGDEGDSMLGVTLYEPHFHSGNYAPSVPKSVVEIPAAGL